MELKRFSQQVLKSLFVCAAMLGGSQASQAGDRAVIIGINKYPYAGTPSDPNAGDLAGPRNDAKSFREFVIDGLGFAPDEVTLLLDQEANRDNVSWHMEQKLKNETSAGDRVVFYFAGHGQQIPGGDAGESDGFDEVILFTNVGKKGAKEWLVDDEISAFFEELSDREVLIVVDSCHSGTISRSLGQDTTDRGRAMPNISLDMTGYVPIATRSRSRENAQNTIIEGQEHINVWSAVAADEVAIEGNIGGQLRGVFTSAFLDGVGQRKADFNGNGTVTNSELLSFVRKRSAEFCANSELCQEGVGRLTPEFSGRIADNALMPTSPQSSFQNVQNTQPFIPPAQPVTDPTINPQKSSLPFENTGPAPQAVFNQPGVLTDLFVPTNDAGLSISVSPDRTLRLGDVVSFDVRARRGGHLLLLDYNPDGELYQIFPSKLSSTGVGKLRPGVPQHIPEAFSKNGKPIRIRVTEPVGQGHLVAILIENDLQSVTDLLPENVNLAPIPDAQGYLYRLAEDLNRLQTTAAGSQQNRWSAAILPYSITR